MSIMISASVIFDQWLAKGTLRQLKRLRSIMYSKMSCKKEVTQRIKELQKDFLTHLINNKLDDEAKTPILRLEKFIKVETPRKGFKEFKRVMI